MRIDGKTISQTILANLKNRVEKLRKKNVVPKLAIILIGDDPASKAYVKRKEIIAKEIGAESEIHNLPADTSEEELLWLLEKLNNDSTIHGLIVQRPLPSNLNSNLISDLTDAKKDVDGLSECSQFKEPVAKAVLKILKSVFENFKLKDFEKWLKSKKIVVIGKGETGGKPIITLFERTGIKLHIIDSKTKNPEQITKAADIIISAVGRSDIIKPEMISNGVILISVGLHEGKDGKLHGDYNEEEVKEIASFYTPTPGGVGPVNVACLLENVVSAAEDSSK